jgi:hypothetical protein
MACPVPRAAIFVVFTVDQDPASGVNVFVIQP